MAVGGRIDSDDDGGRAQVGIESLVVFVALIIVAMLAVTVLLGTTGSLQNAASITGEQSTDQVVQRVSVFSVQERDTRIVEEYTLASRSVSVENRTTTLSNDGTSLSSDWDAPLTATVDGLGNVTLEADGETITVRDGDVLRGVTHGGGRVALKNVNTTERLPTASTISVVDDGDAGTENLTLSYDGSSVTAAETEALAVATTLAEFDAFNADPVSASVTGGGGGGTVTVSDGEDSLTVADGDDLRFYTANQTIRNVDAGTAAHIQEIEVVDDGDGNTETLTLTYDGTTLSLTEGSPFRLDTFPSGGIIEEESGTARTVDVSSGGNVTLTDGSGTLELNDSDDLEVTTPEPGVYVLTNLHSGESLRTDDSLITVADDGDADAGEILRIGPVAAKEGLPGQLRLAQFSSRESTDSGVYTVTVGVGPGSDSVDLADATVAVVGPTNATTLTYAAAGAPETRETFVVVPIKDEGDTAPVLTDDADRFKIRFDAGSVPDDAELTVRITTASGATRVIVVDGDEYRG